MPSTVFSAMVSTAPRVISASSSCSVSRPTTMESAFRADAKSPLASGTAIARPASAKPFMASVVASNQSSAASPSQGCTQVSSSKLSQARPYVPSTMVAVSIKPRSRRRFSLPWFQRCSSTLMARPMMTTGCGNERGSPTIKSMTIAIATNPTVATPSMVKPAAICSANLALLDTLLVQSPVQAPYQSLHKRSDNLVE